MVAQNPERNVAVRIFDDLRAFACPEIIVAVAGDDDRRAFGLEIRAELLAKRQIEFAFGFVFRTAAHRVQPDRKAGKRRVRILARIIGRLGIRRFRFQRRRRGRLRYRRADVGRFLCGFRRRERRFVRRFRRSLRLLRRRRTLSVQFRFCAVQHLADISALDKKHRADDQSCDQDDHCAEQRESQRICDPKMLFSVFDAFHRSLHLRDHFYADILSRILQIGRDFAFRLQKDKKTRIKRIQNPENMVSYTYAKHLHASRIRRARRRSGGKAARFARGNVSARLPRSGLLFLRPSSADAVHSPPEKARQRPARVRLRRALSALCDHADAALRPYLYGFLTHIALDSTLHPYIESAHRGIAHARFEGVIDSIVYAQTRDEFPFRTMLRMRADTAKIDALLSDVSEALLNKNVRGAYTRGFRKYHRLAPLMFDPENRRYRFLRFFERRIRKPGFLSDLLIGPDHEDPEDCMNRSRRAWTSPWEPDRVRDESVPMLFDEAKELAAALFAAFDANDRETLSRMLRGRTMQKGALL